MVWVLVGTVIWVALALPAGVLIGRAIRFDGRRGPGRLRYEGVRPADGSRVPVPRLPDSLGRQADDVADRQLPAVPY